MKRGDVVLVAVAGEFGKPRPALVVQSSLFAEHQSVTVCLFTSHLHDAELFRYSVEPDGENGLQVKSQVQIDKIVTVSRGKIGQEIGCIKPKQLAEITKLLALWIGVAD